MTASQPFEYVDIFIRSLVISERFPSIKVKEINFSYHAEKVFTVDIPALHHGNDGLIYTCVNTPYVSGTDLNM